MVINPLLCVENEIKRDYIAGGWIVRKCMYVVYVLSRLSRLYVLIVKWRHENLLMFCLISRINLELPCFPVP
jgi:hypothetical protein